jgi:hypothetical protein
MNGLKNMEIDEIIKDRFCICKQQGSSKNYRIPAGKYQSDFLKASEICEELSADPIIFVDSQFYGANPDQMFPAFLHSVHSRQKYFDYIGNNQDEDFESGFAIQKIYLTQQLVDRGRTVEEALMDKHIDFEPWFRICVTKEPIKEIIDKYQGSARLNLTEKLKEFLRSKNLDYTRITK